MGGVIAEAGHLASGRKVEAVADHEGGQARECLHEGQPSPTLGTQQARKEDQRRDRQQVAADHHRIQTEGVTDESAAEQLPMKANKARSHASAVDEDSGRDIDA